MVLDPSLDPQLEKPGFLVELAGTLEVAERGLESITGEFDLHRPPMVGDGVLVGRAGVLDPRGEITTSERTE